MTEKQPTEQPNETLRRPRCSSALMSTSSHHGPTVPACHHHHLLHHQHLQRKRSQFSFNFSEEWLPQGLNQVRSLRSLLVYSACQIRIRISLFSGERIRVRGAREIKYLIASGCPRLKYSIALISQKEPYWPYRIPSRLDTVPCTGSHTVNNPASGNWHLPLTVPICSVVEAQWVQSARALKIHLLKLLL